ncbi:hypothetical protein AB0D38_35280 [Streptomyces sp. NPDC048279]|uniref:hypothetical protein n=1 Tax=Streptomyces sp. NPDC048279 TaxID=3154714 RepID=UPI003449ED05
MAEHDAEQAADIDPKALGVHRRRVRGGAGIEQQRAARVPGSDGDQGGETASKVLSTIVVTLTPSASGCVTGSTAGPCVTRGADHAVSAGERP